MLTKTRGYCAIHLGWTGFPFPNNMQPTRGAPAMTFDQLGQQLKDAGTNVVRVKLDGDNNHLGTNAPSFEPKLGQYNNWGGQLDKLVAMCRKYGIGIWAIPFDNTEWVKRWYAHAWNVANGGFLSDRKKVLSPVAYDAAKARVDALIDKAGDVISAWEVCAEMTWMMNRGYWDTTWDGLTTVVRQIAVPWVEMITKHIQGKHGAPVGNGNVHGALSAARNEIHRTPSLDFTLINWYGHYSTLPKKMQWLRSVQVWAGKPVYVEQYAPWAIYKDPDYPGEPSSLWWSKIHEWATVCGEYGAVNPLRWPDIQKGPVSEWWGITHPNLAHIAGVTQHFAEELDLFKWTRAKARVWDGNISASSPTVVSSYGDGHNVTAFLMWGSTGSKTVTISGLANDTYVLHEYNIVTGLEARAREFTVSNGTLKATVDTVQKSVALLIEPSGDPPPDPPDPDPVRTLRVRATLKLDGEDEAIFTGTLNEVDA